VNGDGKSFAFNQNAWHVSEVAVQCRFSLIENGYETFANPVLEGHALWAGNVKAVTAGSTGSQRARGFGHRPGRVGSRWPPGNAWPGSGLMIAETKDIDQTESQGYFQTRRHIKKV
jgi:hypothetical protein